MRSALRMWCHGECGLPFDVVPHCQRATTARATARRWASSRSAPRDCPLWQARRDTRSRARVLHRGSNRRPPDRSPCSHRAVFGSIPCGALLSPRGLRLDPVWSAVLLGADTLIWQRRALIVTPHLALGSVRDEKPSGRPHSAPRHGLSACAASFRWHSGELIHVSRNRLPDRYTTEPRCAWGIPHDLASVRDVYSAMQCEAPNLGVRVPDLAACECHRRGRRLRHCIAAAARTRTVPPK